MAMTMQVTGIDEAINHFLKLGQEVEGIAKASLYKGAGVMADAYNGAVASIQTAPFRFAGGTDKRLPSPQEKAALERKIGIAKFNVNGSEVDTVVGMTGSGYAEIAGKKKPVIVIARSINGGTSFMVKQPVFRRAATKAKGAAAAAMVEEAEKKIKEIIE